MTSGGDGWACYVNGSNTLFYPDIGNLGYADGELGNQMVSNGTDFDAAALTEYLVQEAFRMSPTLLSQVRRYVFHSSR